MLRRIIFLSFSVTILQLLVSCLECPPWPEVRFENKDIEVSNIIFYQANISITNDTILPKKAFGINLKVKSNILANDWNKFNSFSINSAYAFVDCEPEDTIYKVDNYITDINIFTINNIGIEYPQGANVNSLFRMLTFNYNYSEVGSNNAFSLTEMGQVPNLNVNYLLMRAPEFSGIYQFKVVVNLSDNSFYEKFTKPVYLF
jgi:hypothetical protein